MKKSIERILSDLIRLLLLASSKSRVRRPGMMCFALLALLAAGCQTLPPAPVLTVDPVAAAHDLLSSQKPFVLKTRVVVPGDGVDAERVRKTVFEMRLKHDVELASNEIPQLLIHKQIEVRKPNDKGVMQTNKNRVEGVMLLPPEVIKRCTPEPVVAEQLHRKLWWFSGVKVNHEVIPGAWHVKMQFNRRVKLTNSEVREGGTFSSIFAREAVAKAREYIIGFDTEAEARCAAEVLDNLRYYQVRKSDDKSGEAVR